jgi:hypothetical protein
MARARLRCGAAGFLASCALLLTTPAWTGTTAAAGAAAAPDASPPTLGTVVIPDLGPGYTVTSQGPLDAPQFASNAPDPSAAAGALSTLGTSIATYERVWHADAGLNQVQDLLVRFPNAVGAQVFLQAAQHSLELGEIVSSDSVASIPGARRVTYFAATDQTGVGEAITMRAGVYVDLLSFFSAASGNAQPISPANAEQVTKAQYMSMLRAPGGASTTTIAVKKSVSNSSIALAVVVVAVLCLAVATPALLRRRRAAADVGVAGVPSRSISGSNAVDDRRERSG